MSKLMSKEEKERFLNRVKIVTEDISETQNPKDMFIAKINAYQESMKTQVANVENLLVVQTKLKETVEDLLRHAKELNLSEEILKTEISTKQQIILQSTASIAMMKERIALGETLLNNLVNNYDLLCDMDFYFNGVLGMEETETRKDKILKENKINSNDAK